MKVVEAIKKILAFLRAPEVVHAHCDVPCGLYDPHAAQFAALTVIRMNQLIQELAKPGEKTSAAERDTYVHQLSRYTATKEKHAEIVKSEVRIIWGDYFTPDHIKQHPELHELAFEIMKLAGKARQTIDLAVAEQLLSKVHKFAEIFWETKGVKTKKQPSNQKSKGELVYPIA